MLNELHLPHKRGVMKPKCFPFNEDQFSLAHRRDTKFIVEEGLEEQTYYSPETTAEKISDSNIEMSMKYPSLNIRLEESVVIDRIGQTTISVTSIVVAQMASSTINEQNK